METYSPSASKASFPGTQRAKLIRNKTLGAAGGRHKRTASEEPSYKCQGVTPPHTVLQEITKASALGRGSWPEKQMHTTPWSHTYTSVQAVSTVAADINGRDVCLII